MEDIKINGQSQSVLGNTKSFTIKVEKRFSDWDDVNTYRGPHINETGPGQYTLPQLVAVEHKSLSTMRNTPMISIGLPNTKNKPYYKETYSDFIGRSSPNPCKYSPDFKRIKAADPNYSQSKFKRFYKPSSVAQLHEQVPVQYFDDSHRKKSKKVVDLMGMGKRFAYKMEKQDETTPGPGKYSNIDQKSIANVAISTQSALKPREKYVFGVSREQNDKL